MYRAVRFAPDVIDLVHNGSQLTVVPDELIHELKTWAGDIYDVPTLEPDFKPGDRVQITDGPFRGVPATILQARHDRDRVAVLLSVLECGAQMFVSRSQLTPQS